MVATVNWDLPPVGAVVELTQTYDSGMVATFRGTVTAAQAKELWPRAGTAVVTLGGTHQFAWQERQQPSGQWCTMSYKILSIPVAEPADKTVLLVVDGLVRTVWVRCDASAYPRGKHWSRSGSQLKFTWDELLRATKDKKLIKLRGEKAC